MKKFWATMISLTLIMSCFPMAVLADNDVSDSPEIQGTEDNVPDEQTDGTVTTEVIVEETVSEEPAYASASVTAGSWTDLKTAIENAGSDPVTISLTADCESSGCEWDQLVIHDGRNITIELNGHNLNRRMYDPCESGMVIDIHSGCSLTLIGDPISRGMIMGGNCSKNGGGICNSGTLTIQDCIINGNHTQEEGGGIYCAPGANLNIQGYVAINANYCEDNSNNLYLDGFTAITVTGPLDTTSIIYVSGSDLERFITYNWSQSGITDQSTIQKMVKYDDGRKTALYESGELGLRVLYMHRWLDADNQVQEEMTLPPSVPHRITETSTELAPGWYYVEGEVTIPGYIALEESTLDDYNIILTDDSVLNITSLRHYHSSCLRIYGQGGIEQREDPSCNAGRLNAQGSEHLAGIGGGQGLACGSIEIQGGIITARGSEDQPGIGGESLTGSIVILGGDVAAYGGENAAGIGGPAGIKIDSGKVSLYGGRVYAYGGKFGAGIGSGNDADFEYTVDIYGGAIYAYGGLGGGAGIGSGFEADMGGSISISGGYVRAWGQDGGACLGAGRASESALLDGDWRGPISITGGTVRLNIAISTEYREWGAAIGVGLYGDREDGASLTLGDDRSVLEDPGYTDIRVAAQDRNTICTYIDNDPYSPAEPPFQVLLIEECPHDDMTYPLDHATADYHWGNCNYCYSHPVGPHVFEDGECTVCHYNPEAPADPEFVGRAVQLDSGELNLQMFFTLNNVDITRDHYVTLSSQHINITIPSDQWLDGSYKTGYPSYMVQVGVSSIMMAEEITPTLHYYVTGDDEPHEVTSQDPYSVIDYITDLRSSPVVTDRQLAIINNMTDYGYYAQQYLSDLNEWNIGTDYAAITTRYTDSYSYDTVRNQIPSDQRRSVDLDTDVISAATYSVRFGDRISMRIYLKPVSFSDFNPDDIQVNVPDATITATSDNRYAITVTGIPATQLADAITVSYGDSSITVCPASYIYDMLGQDDSDRHKKGKDLVCALFYYAQVLSPGI